MLIDVPFNKPCVRLLFSFRALVISGRFFNPFKQISCFVVNPLHWPRRCRSRFLAACSERCIIGVEAVLHNCRADSEQTAGCTDWELHPTIHDSLQKIHTHLKDAFNTTTHHLHRCLWAQCWQFQMTVLIRNFTKCSFSRMNCERCVNRAAGWPPLHSWPHTCGIKRAQRDEYTQKMR